VLHLAGQTNLSAIGLKGTRRWLTHQFYLQIWNLVSGLFIIESQPATIYHLGRLSEVQARFWARGGPQCLGRLPYLEAHAAEQMGT